MTQRAAWSGEHYADHTAHHRAYDDVLLDRLGPLDADATVLDVGCGVGDFTRGLLALVPDGRVVGIDADPSMIATAQATAAELGIPSARLSFAVTPAQELGTAAAEASIDAIVSTACLHWVPADDHPRVLAGARRILRPGGRWCVEFGGRGQVDTLREVLDPLAVSMGGAAPRWFFPTAQEYADLLAEAGFRDVQVELVHQRRSMPDAEALRGLVTSQVVMAYLVDLPEASRTEFVERGADAVVAAAQARAVDGAAVDYDVPYVRCVASAIAP